MFYEKVVIYGFFLYWCYSLSIDYYDSVKERLSDPYSSILSLGLNAINGYHLAMGIYCHVLK